MKYLLVMIQAEEGCDYTIGCGIQVREFHALNHEQSIEKAKTIIIGFPDEDGDNCSGVLDNETSLESATLYKIGTASPLPISSWEADMKNERVKLERSENKAARKAEYLRLKQEFEGE